MPSVDGDPHFIIQVRENKDVICFNIDEEPGTVLRLIQDPVTGGGCRVGLGPRVFLKRPGDPQGGHMDQVLNLPTMLPSFYVDYMLEWAVQNHRLPRFPKASGLGRVLELRAGRPCKAGLSL